MAYEKSGNLKEDILRVAQEMFRKYGYDGTTFQKIADALDITKGAITYHFKNKHLIMAQLVSDFFQALRDYIDVFPEEYQNDYWRYSLMYIYAYRIIMRDAHNREFFYSRGQMSLWQTTHIKTIYNIYKRIAQDFHKTYTHEGLLMATNIDIGARKQLYQVYMDDPHFLTIDKYAYYHVYLLGLLSKLDEFTVEENIRLAFDFADRHTPPLTGLLQAPRP